jgi:hypothetical protein
MKLKIAIALSLVTLTFASPNFSAENKPSSTDPSYQARLKHEQQQKDVRDGRISGVLSDLLGMEIQIQDDTVVLKGTKANIDEAMARLNNFDRLRQSVIPVNATSVLTQASDSPKFGSFQDFLFTLGIQPSDISNFRIDDKLDENGMYKIPFGPIIQGKLTANQHLAIVFLEMLQEKSPYFAWVCKREKHIITETENYRIINYGLLTQYLCKLEIQHEPVSVSDVLQSRLPLNIDLKGTSTVAREDNSLAKLSASGHHHDEPVGVRDVLQSRLPINDVLKRLTAAAGGDISLVKSSKSGHYHVRTVVLDRNNHDQQLSMIPTVEIIIDASGSMGELSGRKEGESKVDVINDFTPKLIAQFRDSLRSGESLKVIVSTFNEEMKLHKTYDLVANSPENINWEKINPKNGTNLTLVGEKLILGGPDEKKVVVAFTDGKHTASDSIKESMETLKQKNKKGELAKPYFCRVGVNEGDEYFSDISSTFAGEFFEQANIDQFCSVISSSIPSLLESSTPIILSMESSSLTVRQQDVNPDIHTTTETVSSGSTITHRGVKHLVNPVLSPKAQPIVSSVVSELPLVDSEEDVEAQITELHKKLAALESKRKK